MGIYRAGAVLGFECGRAWISSSLSRLPAPLTPAAAQSCAAASMGSGCCTVLCSTQHGFTCGVKGWDDYRAGAVQWFECERAWR